MSLLEHIRAYIADGEQVLETLREMERLALGLENGTGSGWEIAQPRGIDVVELRHAGPAEVGRNGSGSDSGASDEGEELEPAPAPSAPQAPRKLHQKIIDTRERKPTRTRRSSEEVERDYLATLRTHGPLTRTGVQGKANVAAGSIKSLTDRLVAEGKIVSLGANTKGHETYGLPEHDRGQDTIDHRPGTLQGRVLEALPRARAALAEQFKVSEGDVQKALEQLMAEGMVSQDFSGLYRRV